MHQLDQTHVQIQISYWAWGDSETSSGVDWDVKSLEVTIVIDGVPYLTKRLMTSCDLLKWKETAIALAKVSGLEES